jgi:hypothetical protein
LLADTEEQSPVLPGPVYVKSIVAAGVVFTVKEAPATLDALAEAFPASKSQLAMVTVLGAPVGARVGLGVADDAVVAPWDGVGEGEGEGGAAQAEKGPEVTTRTRLLLISEK